MKSIIKPFLGEEQYGFRQGRGHLDFCRQWESSNEKESKMYAIFMDLEEDI